MGSGTTAATGRRCRNRRSSPTSRGSSPGRRRNRRSPCTRRTRRSRSTRRCPRSRAPTPARSPSASMSTRTTSTTTTTIATISRRRSPALSSTRTLGCAKGRDPSSRTVGPILRRGIVLMALGTLVPAAFGSTPPAAASPTVIRVGYIAQAGSLTGRPADDPGALGVAGDAGLLGAREGAEEMSYTARLVGRRLELLEAAARTPAEAAQQAQALVGRDADVLLGGFDAGTALALSQFAAQHAILFFNVGAPDDRLRNEDCARYTFHVEASDAMYLDAAADWFIRGLAFLVDENAPQG
ncbi:MAG: hypothetical protein E6H04_03795, partial [Bacillati bacterium ANGP1]